MAYKKMSVSIQDNQDKLTLEKEQIDMNIYEHLLEIKETVARIETKVEIHNNYEERIRSLEKDRWRIIGIHTGLLAVIATILFLIAKLT